MSSFCVIGLLESDRKVCIVSFWNCHIVEEEEAYPLKKENIKYEFSHTSMLEFCKYLYSDVSNHVDEWTKFVNYNQEDIDEKRVKLLQKLERLKVLINEKEDFWK